MMSLPGAVDRLTTQVSPNAAFAIPGPKIGINSQMAHALFWSGQAPKANRGMMDYRQFWFP
jgi:hypothetical protein